MRLVYVSPCPIALSDGRFSMPQRTLIALEETAAAWPGELVVVAARDPDAEDRHETEWVRLAEAPFVIRQSDDPAQALRELRPTAVYGLHRGGARRWAGICAPTVLTSEVDLRIRMALYRVTTNGPQMARVAVGQFREEAVMRRLARSVAGLECNGPLAYEAYGALAKSAIQFHDHRIRAADVAAARQQAKDSGGALRLAFSGRFTAIKGPQHVVEMARILQERGVDVEVTMFGAGDMQSELRRAAPNNVQFAGFVRFEPDWKKRFREEIDLLIAPHPQGDPSCTYFEALGSGVPVVGFPNATWRRVVERYGVGWVTRRMTPEDLADEVTRLAENRQEIRRARDAGLALLDEHTFERTIQRRVSHIESLV